MLQAFNTLGSNPGMIITAQSVAILDSESGNKTVSDIQFPVMLDSGTTFSYLPTEIAEAIGKSFDGEYSSDDQGYIFDCSKVNDTLLSVDFGGFNISANISNFVTSAKDRCVLNVKQSESTYMLGDAFLVDAYVVYDLENYEISIAQASFNNQEEDIEVISDTVPGATPAPGYFSTWVYISPVVPSEQEILLMSAGPRIRNFHSTNHCLPPQPKAMMLVLSQVVAALAKVPLKNKMQVTNTVLLSPFHYCPSYLIFFYK
nr:BAF_HP1_G0027690.mRNA.1.CDS.1 [Saccharomyces cerevisiae]